MQKILEYNWRNKKFKASQSSVTDCEAKSDSGKTTNSNNRCHNQTGIESAMSQRKALKCEASINDIFLYGKNARRISANDRFGAVTWKWPFVTTDDGQTDRIKCIHLWSKLRHSHAVYSYSSREIAILKAKTSTKRLYDWRIGPGWRNVRWKEPS